MSQLISPFSWSILGIFVIFLAGSFLHFAYQLSGKNIFISFLVPINESVWEHTKLSILPTFLWWILFFLFSSHISINVWLTGLIVSMIANSITIILLFYFYTNSFHFQSLWIDILIYFLGCLIGQLLGYHFYEFSNGFSFVTSLLILASVFFIYTYFTISPPKLPLFQDFSAK